MPSTERDTPSSPGSSPRAHGSLKKTPLDETNFRHLLYNELATERHAHEGTSPRTLSFSLCF